ncbi:hypothetical protein, partial [Ruminococcus callidus]|uniref:hypothetical protein n=1 Tax=Ruminococcus callidus TaxID=40519 RepID=UPI003FD77B84
LISGIFSSNGSHLLTTQIQFSENHSALLTKKLKSVIIVKYVVFRLFLYGTQVFIAEKPASQREPVGISQLHV